MAALPPPPCCVVRSFRDAPQPLEVLRRLATASRHPFLRWAAGGPRDLTRWSFAGADPREVLKRAVGPDSKRRGDSRAPTPHAFRALAARWPAQVRRAGPRLPFAGGWFGVLSYELRSALEGAPASRAPAHGFPGLWLGRYDAVVAWDHHKSRAYLAGTGSSPRAARDAADRLRERLRAPAPGPGEEEPARAPGRVTPSVSPAAYRRRVAAVKTRIRAGDLFQANVSQRFDAPLDGSPLALFERLVARSPTPFATYLELGAGRFVLSASPERFLRLTGRRAETRPMKGTRPRGGTPREDLALRLDLETSEKDRAELAMIVDLSRNDLARSCRPGTVRVARARRLERYATVHQAVAVVTGELLCDRTGVDLIMGAFPPGSVTGAPKVEAMKVIDRLEGEARGPYCGAIGWLDEGGDLDLAVAIRTLCVADEMVSYRVGGGVTLLSDPEQERVETLDKGQALGLAVVGEATPRRAARPRTARPRASSPSTHGRTGVRR